MQVQAPNRLRELREGRGLELYDISARVRRDPATISRWETGKTQVPDDAKTLLAEFFGVTRAYLMGWDEVESVGEPDRSAVA